MSVAPETKVVPVPQPAFEAPPDRELRNPFYRWLMHLGLPLSLSLLLHVGLISFLAFKTFQVITQPQIEVGDYAASLTDALSDRMSSAFQWSHDTMLQTPPDVPPESLESLTDLRELRDVDTSALTPPKDAGESEGFGLGEGRLSLLGTGSGAGEAGSGGFGSGMGGGGRRIGQAGVWDLSIQANKIAYVIDYSGSIVVAVDDLKRELKRSIGALKPSQSFEVILFYSNVQKDQAVAEQFGSGLQSATEEVKKKFFEWIDKKAPFGGSDPLPAVRRALALKPEAIFLFTDGLFDDPNAEAEIKKANRYNTRIYGLVFDEILLGDTSGLARETEGARRLKKVAEQNGGKCKIVTGTDLRKR